MLVDGDSDGNGDSDGDGDSEDDNDDNGDGDGDEDESHFVERHGVDVEGGEDGLLVSHAWVIHIRDLGRNFKKSYFYII